MFMGDILLPKNNFCVLNKITSSSSVNIWSHPLRASKVRFLKFYDYDVENQTYESNVK